VRIGFDRESPYKFASMNREVFPESAGEISVG
jgi:hypothetical protein